MRKLACTLGALVVASGALAGGGDLSRAIGKALFERAWVPAPSSTLANDGLGPLLNARACSACHQGLDRAARTPDGQGGFTHQGIVMKLSDADGRHDPSYGGQLQTASIPGFQPEGRIAMTAAGAAVGDLSFGPLADGTRMGLRAAPALRGLWLLATVPEEAILVNADPDDRDGDGVSGRPNWIELPDGSRRLGRFGLKAAGISLTAQTEIAFGMDLGMSTPGQPALAGDCLTAACRTAPHGGTLDEPEIRHDLVAMLADYLANVPPPESMATQEGEKLVASAGCASCHVPSLPSARGDVRAYTDLLLHDLGDELDGGATEPGVAPTEWRTAPLWGISRAIRAGSGLLHDGRAAGIAEAVALHGGEASAARARFDAMKATDRAALVRYVEGL
jgi:CxxC motif-containing protein (DUF1111 family)